MKNQQFDFLPALYNKEKYFDLFVYDFDNNEQIDIGKVNMFSGEIEFFDNITDEQKTEAKEFLKKDHLYFSEENKVSKIADVLRNVHFTCLILAFVSNRYDYGYGIPKEIGYIADVNHLNNKISLYRCNGKSVDKYLFQDIEIEKANFEEMATALLEDIKIEGDAYTLTFDNLNR